MISNRKHKKIVDFWIDQAARGFTDAETARFAERERIIAILKSMCGDDPDCQNEPDGYCGAYDAEIALIRRETNV